MLELVAATLYALALSIPITLGFGFVYYFAAVNLMHLLRRVFGEEHRGYYLLNIAVLMLAATFLLVFVRLARSF